MLETVISYSFYVSSRTMTHTKLVIWCTYVYYLYHPILPRISHFVPPFAPITFHSKNLLYSSMFLLVSVHPCTLILYLMQQKHTTLLLAFFLFLHISTSFYLFLPPWMYVLVCVCVSTMHPIITTVATYSLDARVGTLDKWYGIWFIFWKSWVPGRFERAHFFYVCCKGWDTRLC